MSEDNRQQDLLDWLHVRNVPDWAVARPLGAFLSFVMLLLFGLAVASALVILIDTVSGASEGGTGSLGTGALVVALLGAPFLIWSTVIKHRTLALSETALFNDKISAAVEGLYSRRQVTRVITAGDEEKILTEWQDDIVQRNGAIDRLEGLARERPSEAPRIANMLSVYVREMSKESKPQSHPRQEWAELVDPISGGPPIFKEEARAKLGLSLDQIATQALADWARGLRPFRTDVEKAVQTLGRLLDVPGIQADAVIIDLREANMQGCDPRGLRFSKAKLNDARIEGANFSGARMEGADLSGARMEGANLHDTRMQRANLFHTRIEKADLRSARMEEARLFQARMEGASLFQAQLKRADLRNARMEGAGLSCARMEGANLTSARFDRSTVWKAASLDKAAVHAVDFTNTPILADQVQSAFGDGSTKLPESIPRPTHWPKAALVWPTFYAELDKWRTDPDGYNPPEP